MKKTALIVCVTAVLGLLWGCSSGGGGSASGEEETSIDLYIPSTIEYAGPDEAVKESVDMEVAFGDTSFTVTCIMSEGSPLEKSESLEKEFVMDYSGNLLSTKTVVAPLDRTLENLVCTYATDGVSTTKTKRTYKVDASGGRTFTNAEKIEYDAGLRVVRRTIYAADVDSAPVRVVTYAYDTTGRLVTEVDDKDGAAAAPADTHTYAYDTSGNRTDDIVDVASDGIDDTRHEYFYDAKGNVVLKSTYSWDQDSEDWKTESDRSDSWYYVYDLQLTSLPERVNYNKDDDGSVDDYTYVTWKLYTAPIQAQKLLDLDLEDFERMFLQTGEVFVPGM